MGGSAVRGGSVFVVHGDVRLHLIDSEASIGAEAGAGAGVDVAGAGAADAVSPAAAIPGAGVPPVLVVPGMGERADEYSWLVERLGDRRVVIVDLRGRGGSDAPERGYTWEEHIGDLRAVVTALGLERPVLVAFSRGSSYALGYALRYPGEVRGLVVGDYLARHAGLPEELADRLLPSLIRGVPMRERMSERVVRRVLAESREVPLWERLGELRCAVLVLRGDRRGAIVTEEQAERWRAHLPTVEVATIAGTGHDLWSRDTDAYLAALRPFLERVGSAVEGGPPAGGVPRPGR